MSSTIIPSKSFGDSSLYDGFYNSSDASDVMKELDSVLVYVPRSQMLFTIFKKEFELPRDKAFYGDVDELGIGPLYRYGSKTYPEVMPWPKVLKDVRDKLYQTTGQYCNHVVVNQYRNGHDHIGFHHDKTKDFVQGSKVLTVSLGATRTLRVKPVMKKRKREDFDECISNKKGYVDFELDSGSLFVLGSKTNEINKHSIVRKRNKDDVDRRISLTFRSIATMRQKDGVVVENHYDCNKTIQ